MTAQTTDLNRLVETQTAAAKAKEAAHAELTARERDVSGLMRTLAPGLTNDPTADVVARLEADRDLPEARRRLALARLAAHEADRAEADARETVRAAKLAENRGRQRVVAKELEPVMRQAKRLMTRFQVLENDATQIAGLFGGGDRFAWPSLTENDQGVGFLDEWIERLRNAGLLER